jgi:hypothetical protein
MTQTGAFRRTFPWKTTINGKDVTSPDDAG